MTRSTKRLIPLVVLACLLALTGAAHAKSLQGGTEYHNLNFAPVTLTYSWSGHYPGQPEICLLPKTVTIPAGGSVHLDPPPGFVATDFVVISSILRGKDSGGFTVYDPPSQSEMTRIDIPCPDDAEQVWGFLYFGETDFGPVFANAPLAMDGFAGGRPNVVAAETTPDGPVINTSGGHCMVATAEAVLADATTTEVLEKYRPRTTRTTCSSLTFGPSDLSAKPAGTE